MIARAFDAKSITWNNNSDIVDKRQFTRLSRSKWLPISSNYQFFFFFFCISHTQTITIHYIYNSLQVTVIVYKEKKEINKKKEGQSPPKYYQFTLRAISLTLYSTLQPFKRPLCPFRSPDQEFIWMLGCITWACLLGTEKDSNHKLEWNGSGRRPRAGLIYKVIK